MASMLEEAGVEMRTFDELTPTERAAALRLEEEMSHPHHYRAALAARKLREMYEMRPERLDPRAPYGHPHRTLSSLTGDLGAPDDDPRDARGSFLRRK